MKYTENYEMKKPETSDFYDVEDFNDNADTIDLKLKELETARDNIDKQIAELKKSVRDGKGVLASAITIMGGDAKTDDTFESMKTEIENITPELSWNEQTVSADINGNNVVSDDISRWSGATSDRGIDITPDKTTKTIFNAGDRGYFAGPFRVAPLGGNATSDKVLSGSTFSSNSAGRGISGTMTNQSGYTAAASTAIGGDTLYAYIPKGAYLTAGGNGTYPEITIPSIGTASASQVLSGCTFTSSGGKCQTGSMANRGAVSSSLNCGGSYTIPAGYHNGSGKVTANSLVSQTSANAIAGYLAYGQTAWVNGVKITGTCYGRTLGKPNAMQIVSKSSDKIFMWYTSGGLSASFTSTASGITLVDGSDIINATNCTLYFTNTSSAWNSRSGYALIRVRHFSGSSSAGWSVDKTQYITCPYTSPTQTVSFIDGGGASCTLTWNPVVPRFELRVLSGWIMSDVTLYCF